MTAVIDGVRARGYTPGMERTIDIHLRLSYDFRSVKPWLVLAFLALPAGDLASESVTLTTYYPAPSGVYTQMITTNNTYLARDGGNVGVGTVSPAFKLDVTGTENVTGQANLGKLVTTGNNVVNPADPMAADIVVGSNAGTRHDSSIMFWSNASASRIFGQNDVFYFSTWNQNATSGHNVEMAASLGGSSRFRGNVGVGSSSAFSTVPNASGRGYLMIDNTSTGCSQMDVTQGAVCGVGQYATFQPGLYVKGWSYANRGGTAYALTDATKQVTYEVWSNVGGGVGQWATLHQNPASAGSGWTDVASAHIWCCPE